MSERIRDQQARIIQCFKQMDDLFHDCAVEQDLPDSAFWILYTLCQAERPYTQRDFCEEWYYSKQTIHSAAAGLARAGYVVLEHLSGSRNSKCIVLTAAGRAYADAHMQPLLDAELRAFGRLSAEERDAYVHLTEKHLALMRGELTAAGEKMGRASLCK